MKRLTKILCLVLAVALVGVLFVSCKDKGEMIAAYGDNPVYEADVQDLQNYQIVTQWTEDMTDNDYILLMQEAARTYVKFQILELELKENGYEIDEEYLEESIKAEKEGIEKSFEGGYKAWMEYYGVSKNFIEEEVRRYLLAELYYEYALKNAKVSDEEIQKYYDLHAQDYYNPAGYNFTYIFREVLDVTDETECAAAKEEAQEYINEIRSGLLTLEDAETEFLAKYKSEDGYVKAELFNTSDAVPFGDMVEISDKAALDVLLAEFDEVYKDRDPNAANDSEAYANYMNYIGECFEAEVYYALQHLEEGEVYELPIKSFVGYAILRLDAIVDKSNFTPIEDVKEEIIYTLIQENIETGFDAYLEELEEKYDVSYLFEL